MRCWPRLVAVIIASLAAVFIRTAAAAAARASAAPAFVPVPVRAGSAAARLTTAMPRQATKKAAAGGKADKEAAPAPAPAKKAPPTTRRRKRPAGDAGDGGMEAAPAAAAAAAVAAALTPAVAPAVAATEGCKRAKKAAAKEIIVPPATAAAGAPRASLLFTLPPLLRAEIVNRPSKVVKSPYLADIKVVEENDAGEAKAGAADGGGKGKKRAVGTGKGKAAAAAALSDSSGGEETHMAHTPSLGCGNLVSAGASVLVSRSTSATAKSKFVVHHVLQREADGSEHLVGTHPQTAEKLALAIIEGGFAVGPVTAVAREVTMGNSRFDFVATHADGSTTVVECKNVPIGRFTIPFGVLSDWTEAWYDFELIIPLSTQPSTATHTADYCDGTKKERATIMAGPDAPSDPYEKLGIFPEGYRKKASEPVSPRALKHIQELQAIAEQRDPKRRAMLLFVTQRTDVRALCITKTDEQYRAACQEAMAKGVTLKAFAVRWAGNQAYLHKELSFVWED